MAETERPALSDGDRRSARSVDRVRRHPGAHRHLLGCRRVHRRRLHAGNPASARYAAVRHDRPHLGAAAPHRRVRLPDQSAERHTERLGRGLLLPRRARVAAGLGGLPRGLRPPPPAHSSARSPSPTGRTRTRPRSTRSRPSRSRAMCWAANLWRRQRDTERGPRFLLLVVFLAGISIGNHLLALLAGPAVVGYLVAVLWREPAADPFAPPRGVGTARGGRGCLGAADRHRPGEYGAHGSGMRSPSWARRCSRRRVARVCSPPSSFVIAAVGITPYLYLYIRSGQHPVINEAAPATFDALLAVIRRAQYPPRTPLDDPTMPHGPGQPRTHARPYRTSAAQLLPVLRLAVGPVRRRSRPRGHHGGLLLARAQGTSGAAAE